MNMLTLLYFVTSKQPKNKAYPQNPILRSKSVATTNTTHQEYTSPGAPTYPSFSKPLKICIFQVYQSLSGSVYTRKYYKSFGFTRLFDLNMKIHFKTTWWKRLLTPSRTNLRRLFLLFTVSPPWPQRINLKQLDQKNNFDEQVYPS